MIPVTTAGRCSLKASGSLGRPGGPQGPGGGPWAPPPPMAPMAMSPPSPEDFREDWLGAEAGNAIGVFQPGSFQWEIPVDLGEF